MAGVYGRATKCGIVLILIKMMEIESQKTEPIMFHNKNPQINDSAVPFIWPLERSILKKVFK